MISIQPSTQYEENAKGIRQPHDLREFDSGSNKNASFAYRSAHRKNVALDPYMCTTLVVLEKQDTYNGGINPFGT